MTDPYRQATPTDPSDDAYLPVPSAHDTPRRAVMTAARGGRSRRLLFAVAAIAVVLVVGVGGYVAIFQKSGLGATSVGDCVSMSGSSTSMTAKRISCDDPKALYVVTATGTATNCDAGEVTYSGSGIRRTNLCLFYNVRQGECLASSQQGGDAAKTSCTPGTIKVVSVRTDTSDKTQCPTSADLAKIDITRKRMVCFETVT